MLDGIEHGMWMHLLAQAPGRFETHLSGQSHCLKVATKTPSHRAIEMGVRSRPLDLRVHSISIFSSRSRRRVSRNSKRRLKNGTTSYSRAVSLVRRMRTKL